LLARSTEDGDPLRLGDAPHAFTGLVVFDAQVHGFGVVTQQGRAKALRYWRCGSSPSKFVAHEFERFFELTSQVLCSFPVNLNRHGTLFGLGDVGVEYRRRQRHFTKFF
jgi:hypothetical protein